MSFEWHGSNAGRNHGRAVFGQALLGRGLGYSTKMNY